MRQRGKFFVLEGGDGAGKSTVLRYLEKHLPAGRFVFTREPGGTEEAERIREMFLHRNHNEPLDLLTELLLIHAARRQHIVQRIQPAIERGISVVCDRFDTSTYAYQIREKDSLFEMFRKLQAEVCGTTLPDFTIFLDVRPEVGIARARKRAVEKKEDLSRFDSMPPDFHEKIRKSMKEYLRMMHPTKYAEVDASRGICQVSEAVLEIISRRTRVAA